MQNDDFGCKAISSEVFLNCFEKILYKNNTPFVKFGQTTEDKLPTKNNGKGLISLQVEKLREKWKNTIWDIME